MRITAKVDPREVEKALRQLAATADQIGIGIGAMLLREGADMEREIKQELNVGGRTTERGPRGGRIVNHSAPGEPPRKQTCQLQNSIGYEAAVENGNGNFYLDVGAIRGTAGGEVQHAAPLELGTSTMAPRPYIMPVVDRHLANWKRSLSEMIRRLRAR